MKVRIVFLLLIVSVGCDYPLPEDWRDAKDPLDTEHYQEILDQYFPQYIDFGDEDNEVEGRGDGKQGISRHITNGMIADYGQFDHHVLLYMFKNGYSYLCGASLVRYNWIITAAHCVIDMTSFSLYLGIINRSGSGSAQWMQKVTDLSHAKMHPYYDDNTLQNDIAMMFMVDATEELLTYSNVAIINLPSYEHLEVNLTSRDGSVCGFGRTSDDHDSTSSLLRYIIRPIISNEACGRVFKLFPGNLCIDTQGGQSTCNGDSGGGLTTKIDTEEPFLVGIVSFGASSGCTKDYPTGFTAILSYLDWIDAVFDNTEDEYTTSTIFTTDDEEISNENERTTESTTTGAANSVKMMNWIIFVSQVVVFAVNIVKR